MRRMTINDCPERTTSGPVNLLKALLAHNIRAGAMPENKAKRTLWLRAFRNACPKYAELEAAGVLRVAKSGRCFES